MRGLWGRVSAVMLLVAGICYGQARTNTASHGSAEKKTVVPARIESTPTNNSSVARLPIRRVVLYKNGVGYFEHLGRVHGDQAITVDFTSGQLNDVLKSLTILDLNGGHVAGVDYNSEAPFSERLGELRLPVSERATISEFLGALRGANLELRNVSGSAAVTGRLLSVERKTRASGGTTLEVDVVTLVTDSGEVREVELSPAVSVRLAEQGLHQEVNRYLSLLASERDQDLRRMTISTAGPGERQLYVSYISEVPVWKTTYRLVLPKKAGDAALLQGWAIVDNTVGEDWNDVELSLVAGAPQSFVQQLSQPYYSRRPIVGMPESAQLTPQTHQGTMMAGFGRIVGIVGDPSGAVVPYAELRLIDAEGRLVATTTTDGSGNYAFEGLAAGDYQLQVEKKGFKTVNLQGVAVDRSGESKQNLTLSIGSIGESVTVSAAPVEVETTTMQISKGSVGGGSMTGSGRNLGPIDGRGGGGMGAGVGRGTGGGVSFALAPGRPVLDQARQQWITAAQGQDLGDLFEYKLKDRVTIHKNQSALVPILETKVTAEKVSLWNEQLHSSRPLRALWLTNSSPLTLDGGSFSVLEDETFAGEGLVDAIKPGEKRLVSYAVDLAMRVEPGSDGGSTKARSVKISHGVLTQTKELLERKRYTIRNEDDTPRSLVIEHPQRDGWKLADTVVRPEETSAGFYRFRIQVGPKATEILHVAESKPLETTYEISSLTDDQVALFLKQGSINTEVEAALRPIAAQKALVASLDDDTDKRNDEMQKIYDDQQRLREDMKALKGSTEEKALLQRYVKQLDEQETRLEVLRKEVADLEAKKEQAQANLDAMIEKLSLEVTL